MASRILAISLADTTSQDHPELLKSTLHGSVTALAYADRFAGELDHVDFVHHLRLHPREEMFWWRLLRDAVPTVDWMLRRGLADVRTCPWGCGLPEDTAHVTTHCLMLRQVLLKLNSWGCGIPQFQSHKELCNAFLHTKQPTILWAKIYCGAVYQVWKSRNDKRHGRPAGNPASMAATVMGSLLGTHKVSFTEQWGTIRSSGLICPNFWCPPPPEWIKCNVDGALQRIGSGGLGVVFRGNDGKLLKAAGKRTEHWDCIAVELMAVGFIGEVMEPWMTERKGIIIEGDCLAIINLLQAGLRQEGWRAQGAASLDLGFLLQFKQVIFRHVGREVNRAADFCASAAVEADFCWVDCSVDCPPPFLSILRADMPFVPGS